MNKKIKLAALLALVVFTLMGCDNALHNGTEMAISKVTVTGLPSDTYPEGKEMVFSYNRSSTDDDWIHDDDLFTDPYYSGTVNAEGTLTFNFSPALELTTPKLVFLIIDPDKTWAIKIASNHSLDGGSNVELDNTWAGALNPEEVEGVVDGDSVNWDYKVD
ncbi:hypothetical protein EW093_04440 [Thiospirochaeta perfilievii]|uniref:Lipoprotein n=1 Tax=Thiospirochaeta perfilievii TaxID=252967 RepID=A0A5C1QAN1_9SPIO|nr:hypothetical protein [Thiospirochaeta perfilievii]QEN03979.1 hypothetical protein EW093_04440 [Thiospirochaeta perfilievii]